MTSICGGPSILTLKTRDMLGTHLETVARRARIRCECVTPECGAEHELRHGAAANSSRQHRNAIGRGLEKPTTPCVCKMSDAFRKHRKSCTNSSFAGRLCCDQHCQVPARTIPFSSSH